MLLATTSRLTKATTAVAAEPALAAIPILRILVGGIRVETSDDIRHLRSVGVLQTEDAGVGDIGDARIDLVDDLCDLLERFLSGANNERVALVVGDSNDFGGNLPCFARAAGLLATATTATPTITTTTAKRSAESTEPSRSLP